MGDYWVSSYWDMGETQLLHEMAAEKSASGDLPIELLVVIVSGLTALCIAVFNSLASNDRRARLLSDIEILGKLDDKSAAHGSLLSSIENRVLAMHDSTTATRDRSGIAVAIAFLVVGGALFQIVNTLGGWGLLLHVFTAFFLLFGIVGLSVSMPKVPRDEKGRRIKHAEVGVLNTQPVPNARLSTVNESHGANDGAPAR